MNRKLIKITYDGSGFNGWQIQTKGRTVQQVLEKAVTRITGTPVSITASGRTDSGVHALGQYAHFDFPLNMDNQQILLALNSGLPADIRILVVKDVPDDFHARYDARKRVYKYFITREITPFNRNYRTYLPRFRFFPDRITACLKIFSGQHDFASFAKANEDLKTTVCTIDEFYLEILEGEMQFTISADRFLHNMVRRLIGTTINITSREFNVTVLQSILDAKNPANDLIYTAPAQGLYLYEVLY